MFGFVRRAKENWESKVNNMRAPVVDDLNNLLVHVASELTVAHGFAEGDENHKMLLEKHRKIVFGFLAFRDGGDPRKISDAYPLMKCAAALAQVACDRAILDGKLDMEKMAGELRYILGFSRDGSEIDALTPPSANKSRPTIR